MKVSLLFLLLLFIPGLARAQVAAGGVQLCGKKATFYAFYEGGHPKLHHISVWKESDERTDVWIERALQHISADIPSVASLIRERTGKILGNLDSYFVDKLFSAGHPTDVTFLDAGCTYEEASLWDLRGDTLEIQSDLFQRLSPMGKAGLIFYEAIYKLSRDSKITGSNTDSIRKLIAKIFSDETLTEEDALLIENAESRVAATLPYCTSRLDYLAKTAKLYSSANEICKKYGKDEETQAAFMRVKNLIIETGQECLERCLWPEGRKTCQDFLTLLDKPTKCD